MTIDDDDDSLISDDENNGRMGGIPRIIGTDYDETPKKTFRLNAPQGTFGPDESLDSMASIGDHIEDPSSNDSDSETKPVATSNGRSSGHIEQPLEESRPQKKVSRASRTFSDDPNSSELSSMDPRLAALDEVNHTIEEVDGTEQRLSMKCFVCVGMIVIALLLALIAVVAFVLGGSNLETSAGDGPGGTRTTPNSDDAMGRSEPTPSPNLSDEIDGTLGPPPDPTTTLGLVFLRGFLRCGIPDQPGFGTLNIETGLYEGFDADLCRAVAAAIFGEDGHVELIPVDSFDRFIALAEGEVDMLARTTTHTMERQINETTTGRGYSFSIPYLYNGLQFGGFMPYVECANNLTTSGVCANTTICVLDGTTHIADIPALNPDFSVVTANDVRTLYRHLASGYCHVIAGEQFEISEWTVKQNGVSGDYKLGSDIHSKEPLCLVTRDDDAQWSDFVNWVLQALLAAEDEGISQRTAYLLSSTDVFGRRFRGMFINAVGTVGNYAEIYRRHLEEILPRRQTNIINKGSSGLIFALPFGSLQSMGDGAIPGGTLELIRERGELHCGVSKRAIFAQHDPESDTWRGFDVDFCRALSAAIFNGDPERVAFTDLSASRRFQALASGEVDVLSRITTLTLSRDVKEPNTGVGFSFSQPTFYDGMTFGGLPKYAQCADRLDVTSLSCKTLLICVNRYTTFENIMRGLFPERYIVPRQSRSIEGLMNGDCNTIAGGVGDVSITSVRSEGYDGLYQTGATRFSKDPLALVTRQDDIQWSRFVFWIVSTIFYAEEQGITKLTANETLPEVNLFGPDFVDIFKHAVGAVGSYAEIYERSAEADIPRGGLNQINRLFQGPQHYPYPGVL